MSFRLLDTLLRDLLLKNVPGLASDSQVRFEPPDSDWRTYVGNLQKMALNVYAVDARENRVLRSNQDTVEISNGVAHMTPEPVRMDFHYLISAWSPAKAAPAIEPQLDEHALLYRTAAALFKRIPLVPASVYPPGSAALNAWDPAMRNAEIPTLVSPPEGYPKLAEFWSGMGVGTRWKPCLYLIATIPIAMDTSMGATIVTTRIIEYRQVSGADSSEIWIQIGGTVRDGGGVPVPRAWVQLETPTGAVLQTTTANDLGRFDFDGLTYSRYRLRSRAAALGEQLRVIDVPSTTGDYDVRFP